MYLFFAIKLLDWKVLWLHFWSTSGLIGCKIIHSQLFSLHLKIRRKILREVLGGIFTYDSIVWALSSILTLMSVFWQIKAQLLSINKQRLTDAHSANFEKNRRLLLRSHWQHQCAYIASDTFLGNLTSEAMHARRSVSKNRHV